MIDAQFDFAPGTSWADAARATIDAAGDHGGPMTAETARLAFVGRGIQPPPAQT